MSKKPTAHNSEISLLVAVMLFLPVLFGGTVSAGTFAQGKTSPQSLRVVLDNNYPPYVFQAADGTIQGILVDQWRLFEKTTGIRVELSPMDWGSAIKAMKAGQFDVIDTIFKTDERQGWLDFTEPYARLEVPVFFNAEISGISDAASLQGFAVAAKEGDAAVDILRGHGVANLLLFNSYEEIIRAAKEHKANVFVVDEPPALYFLHKFEMQELYKKSSPLYVGEFHRAVRKGDSSILQAITGGFGQIPAVELQQIEGKWMGTAIPQFLQAKILPYLLIAACLIIVLITALYFWNRALRKAVATRTRALRTSEERYRLLFNAESDAIVVIDVETLAHVEANEAAVSLYGYSHAELLQLHPTDLSAEPEQTRFQIGSGSGTVRIPLRYHKKSDGTILPVEIVARFFELDGKKMLLAAMRDISERLRAEEEQARLREELSQARKMESIGRLAGGIAHDFNNMLGVILGHAELALMRLPEEAPLRKNLTEIDKAARRSAELTRRLLAFARKQKVMPKVLDLNEIVDGMLAMLGRLIGEDIDLRWSPGENLWSIKMDPSQLDQILANLCANARDAIRNIGQVVISTANRHFDAAFCDSHEGCREGDFVVLSVADNGCGMDKEVLAHLFEPFYTTKEVGKGTGLGLATVYGIAQQNGGFITVDSEPGEGSRFAIFLPRHGEQHAVLPQEPAAKERSSGTVTFE